MTSEISNYNDVIDSRDVIERAAELAARWTDAANGGDSEPLDEDEHTELDTLSALIDEASSRTDDWEYGATLVRDDYWREYAEQCFDDVYGHELGTAHESISAYVKVDYDMFARDLQMDYTSVDFGGVTYWVRG